MAGRDEFLAHVLDLLAPLGGVDARRMFGGYGLYCGDVFFGILLDNTLYLKADDQNRRDFERAGSEIFSYARAGKHATLNFYRAPEEAMDTSLVMLPWARSSVAAALRSRAAKPASRKRPARKRVRTAGSRSRRR